MPETIISQFQRAFNSPIEIYRQVATPTERDNIPSGVRWTGMLVYVVSDGVTYSLSGGGVDNGSWELLGGLQDAPSDGQTYGRKDGNWELIPDGGVDWGDIGGVLSAQTDLQSALDAKATDSNVVHKTGQESISGQKSFMDSLSARGPVFGLGVPGDSTQIWWYPRTSFPVSASSEDFPILMVTEDALAFFPLGSPTTWAGIFDYSQINTSNKTFTFPNQSGMVALQTAASGSFTTSDSKTVTVVNGIITSIV